MAKSKGKKTKGVPYTPENIDKANAKKLLEKEKSKTQMQSEDDTSTLDRNSGKSHSTKKKNTEHSSTSTANENTQAGVAKTVDSIEVKNLSKRTSLLEIAESHNKTEEQLSLIAVQGTDKVDVEGKVSEPILPTSRDSSGSLENISPIIPKIEPDTMKACENKRTKESNTNPVEMQPTKKVAHVSKSRPDNPAWTMGLPSSGLNPDASEFKPVIQLGDPSHLQPKMVYPNENATNLPSFVVPVIEKGTSNLTAHSMQPNKISQTTVTPGIGRNFHPPGQTNLYFRQEDYSEMSVESISVDTSLAGCNSLRPDLKNATDDSWQCDDEGMELNQDRKITSSEQNIQDASRSISGTNLNLLERASSENLSLEPSQLHEISQKKDLKNRCPSDKYREPSHPAENQWQESSSPQETRNKPGQYIGDGRNDRNGGGRRFSNEKERGNYGDKYRSSERSGRDYNHGGYRENRDSHENIRGSSRNPRERQQGREEQGHINDNFNGGNCQNSNTFQDNLDSSYSNRVRSTNQYQRGQQKDNFDSRDSRNDDRRRHSSGYSESSSKSSHRSDKEQNWRDRNKDEPHKHINRGDSKNNYGYSSYGRRDNRNNDWGKFDSNKIQHNRDENREPIETINIDSSSKDSSDSNYHISDYDSNDISNTSQEVQRADELTNQRMPENISYKKDGFNFHKDQKNAWNTGQSKYPRSRETKIDPRMEREKERGKTHSSSREKSDSFVGGSSSSGTTGGSDRCLKQTRITTFTNQETSDHEFDLWEKIWGRDKDFDVVREIQGNLFEQPKDFSLAHCVAEDLRMGSGIAVDFKSEFKNLPDLLDQRAKQGGLATLHDEKNNRYVYYLVTKRESTGKPTYLTLWKSLCKMRAHIKKYEVKKLAIPRLGCGLDRLEWNKVKSMIEHLFKEVDIELIVCNFQQEEEVLPKKSVTCKLVVEDYPVTKIGSGTLILYFSTENGDVDESMREMSTKFKFLTDFKNHKSKKLGEIVYTEDQSYGLVGCIVRKSTKDEMNFKSLFKCIQEFNKKNRKFKKGEAFEYVSYQWVKDSDYQDDMINNKIITILINYLCYVDVYVCRGEFEGNRE